MTTKLGYSCFIDRLGTEVNAVLPESPKRKLKGCAQLVVVGTTWSGTRDGSVAKIAFRLLSIPHVLSDSVVRPLHET
jgi:hypothetical protein